MIRKKNNWQIFRDNINEGISNCLWKFSENQLDNGLLDIKYLKVKMMKYKSKKKLHFFGNYVNNSEFEGIIKKIEKTEQLYNICKKILRVNEIYFKEITVNKSDMKIHTVEKKYLKFLTGITYVFYKNGIKISNFSQILTLRNLVKKKLKPFPLVSPF